MGTNMANAIDAELSRELAELQLELKKRQWLSALRWRERMQICLASSGITFTQWLILDAVWSLVDRTGDAVSQNALAKAVELDPMAIWHGLAVLDHGGLVSRGRSLSGKVWRVFVTSKGADLLRALQPAIERASAPAS